MPRFYFHVRNGAEFSADDQGSDLPDRVAARYEAIQTLAEMARDKLPEGGAETDLSVEVTDASGLPLFDVELVFHLVDRG